MCQTLVQVLLPGPATKLFGERWAVVVGIELLPAAMERVRRKLASAHDGNRQMVDILAAVLTDGLPAVETACAEAVGHGVHSADVVLNILARQRDPGPPLTILTHPPVADCARYDSLRRT